MKSIGGCRRGLAILTTALAVVPSSGSAQTPRGSVTLTVGYDVIPDGDAVLEDGGPGMDVGAGWFVAGRWQLSVSAGIKYASATCIVLVGSATSAGGCGLETDLYSFLGGLRYWFGMPGAARPATPFVGVHSGLAVRRGEGSGALGLPLGAVTGVMIPLGTRFSVLASVFLERIFFEQEFNPGVDRAATRAGIRAGIGWLLP